MIRKLFSATFPKRDLTMKMGHQSYFYSVPKPWSVNTDFRGKTNRRLDSLRGLHSQLSNPPHVSTARALQTLLPPLLWRVFWGCKGCYLLGFVQPTQSKYFQFSNSGEGRGEIKWQPGDQLRPARCSSGLGVCASGALDLELLGRAEFSSSYATGGKSLAALRDSRSNNASSGRWCQVHPFSRACKYPQTPGEVRALENCGAGGMGGEKTRQIRRKGK